MKIGLLCENYFPTLGGEQEHILNLRHHLEHPRDGSPGVEVRVIVPHSTCREWRGPSDDRSVVRPARSMRIYGDGSTAQVTLTPHAYVALRRLFAHEKFDLLHIHAPCDIGLPSWALSTFDGPIVGTLHSYFAHSSIRVAVAPWYRYVMRRLTRVIAVSEAARDAVARYADFDCEIIGNGVDCDAFRAGRRIDRFADGMTNILMVGRLEPRNGIDVVINGFGLLARERPDVRLILAGDGPFRPRYERQVARLPKAIARRVVFLGAVWHERADLYASAHCVALGARKTSFSILLLEALAAGLRVAALPAEGSSHAGPHWSLTEMSRSDRSEDYADALTRALVPMAQHEVVRARDMARKYDWPHIVGQIRQVYQDALGARTEQERELIYG